MIPDFESREDFINYLKSIQTDNKIDGIVIKFTADWCDPCKKIKDFVEGHFKKLPDTLESGNLDVDENFDLYANLKRLKQVQGIPCIVFYKKGNVTFIPDKFVNGTDESEINEFFESICSL